MLEFPRGMTGGDYARAQDVSLLGGDAALVTTCRVQIGSTRQDGMADRGSKAVGYTGRIRCPW